MDIDPKDVVDKAAEAAARRGARLDAAVAITVAVLATCTGVCKVKDDNNTLIAIAMLAVTALTRQWALYWVALVPTVFGVLVGVAGLAALPIHPDTLIRLLS